MSLDGMLILVELPTSRSSEERKVSSHMASASIPKDLVHQLEAQVQIQKEKLELIQATHESINSLNAMLSALLEEDKMKVPKTISSPSRERRIKNKSPSEGSDIDAPINRLTKILLLNQRRSLRMKVNNP